MMDKTELIAHYTEHPLDPKYVRLVAHDVRNQINTIMMASDMLRELLKGAEGDPQRYVNIINHASEDVLIILEAAVAALKGRDENAT